MANYKKLETLTKNFTELTDEMLEELVNNDQIDVSTLSDKEKFAVLVFTELARVLNNKHRNLILDCNYAKSKFHNRTAKQRENGLEDEWLVNYARLVSDANVPMLHIWTSADPKNGKCTFEIHITTDVAPILQEREDEFQFSIKRRKNGVIRDVLRTGIEYENLVSVVNALCALLADAAANKTEKNKVSKKNVKAAVSDDSDEVDEDIEE